MPIEISGGGAGGGSGTVTSVSSTTTGIAVATPTTTPALTLATLDVIAADGPAAANWSNNSHKITSLANGSAAQDAAAFGQIPTALPPNGSAGGSLTGTYPNPTIAASGVTAATYGDSTHVAQVAVAADGRVTSASSVAIAYPGGELDYVQITAGVTVSASSTSTVITGNAVTYDGSTRVKIEVFTPDMQIVATNGEARVQLFEGASGLGQMALSYSGNSEQDRPLYAAVFLTPSNGSHTYLIKVQNDGSGNVVFSAGAGGSATTNYPAWYRITKA